jgi:hypothetical protein
MFIMKKIKLCNIMKKLNIINYSMNGLIENEDYTYDCNTNFIVNKKLIYKGKLIIRFNKINDSFVCSFNDLITLENSPKEVNGLFDCHWNKLTSLKFCPEIINGDFLCHHNKLTNLEHCPKIVNGCFYCSDNSKQFTEEEVRQFCKIKGRIIN